MSTQVGVGKSSHRNPKMAAKEAVELALKSGAMEKPDFVFLFSAVGYNQNLIVQSVYEACGGVPLSGCSAEGTIAGWEADESNFSVVVMTIRSDELRFTNGIAKDLEADPVGAGHSIAHLIQKKVESNPLCLFLFPDALKFNFERFKSAFEKELDLGRLLPMVGGTAGDNWQWKQTYQYCNDQVASNSVAWALLSGEGDLACAVNHGCVSMGVSHKVTRSEGNIIYEIDGKPSMETLKKYLSESELTTGWGTALLNFPLGFKPPQDVSEDYGKFFLRAMMSKDDQTGAVMVPTDVSENETFYMTRRDYNLIVSGVERLGDQIKEQMGSKIPKMVLQFECAGRGNLFMREDQKSTILKSLHQKVGPEVPWLGFYTYGEIGPLAGNNHIHNYTCVLVAVY